MEFRVKRSLVLSILALAVAGCDEPVKEPVVQDAAVVEEQNVAAQESAAVVAPSTTGTQMQKESGQQATETETPQAGQPPAEIPPIDPAKPDALGVGHSGGADPHIALTPEQQVTVALQHRSEGRLPEALVVLDQAIEKFPDSSRLYGVRSDIRRDSRDLAGALGDMEQAVRLDPQNPLFLVGRSQLYLRFERLEEAEADLTRAIELQPDLVAARFNRGTLYAHNGDYAKALVDLEACIAVEPHLPAPYFNRGSVFYNLGRKDEAIADIEHFIELTEVESWKQAGEDLLRVWRESAETPLQDTQPVVEKQQ